MAGKHGGAWKVAYADFVTAMMAFFLVMWITGQSKAVKQAIAKYFNDPWKTSAKPSGDSAGGSPLLPSKPGQTTGIERTPPGPHSMGRASPGTENKQTPKEKKKAGWVPRPSLMAIHAGDERTVGVMVVFPEDATELNDAGKEQLRRVLPEYRGKPHKIEIRGQAANHPLSPGNSAVTPWELSYARCRSTMEFLVGNGIEPERIRLSQGGPYEPYSISDDPAARARNSRVEVYMLSELTEDLVGTPEERAKRFKDPGKAPAVEGKSQQ
jgi:chemotaxis protein MotB